MQPQSTRRRFCVTFWLLLGSTWLAQAQFTAYNDHYAGPGTHPNATAWNVYGTTGGAPGNSGPLKDIQSGANLPVTITITNLAVGGGTTSGGPNSGTPAYNVFNGYIDWGNGTVNHAIQTTAAQAVGRIFSGLDPAKRYRYTCTAVRGGGYVDRWIKITLLDAVSFSSAHTGGCLTNGTSGVSLANNECALSSGDNTAGDIVVWENIRPSASGTFAVHCTQYTGMVPNGGSSGGSYGYSITAEKLEELVITETPAGITNQPQNQTVLELFPVTFNVGVTGTPRPTLQWYRGNAAIPNATNASYTLATTATSDNGATFFVVASNYFTNVSYVVTSSVATLTVLADTNPPTLVSALSSGGLQVQVSFSEPVTEATATNLANYAITNLSGVLAITNAVLLADRTNVVLYTLPQVIGNIYTLTVNGVSDRSAGANIIAPNSQRNFTALDYTASNVGSPALPGTFVVLSSSDYNVTGSGADIGGTSDQFTLASQQKGGDFDVKVRVNRLSFTDPWAKAALMARESVAANSVFAAAVAGPLITGSYFESRATTGASAANSGTFPANFPDNWLRLKRSGNVFTGYASADGRTWVQLGSATLAIGSVYLGFAVTSHDATQVAAAQYRDYGNTDVGGTIVPSVNALTFTTEPLSSAARTTPIVISEIMYKPGGTNTNDLEFVELYNSNPYYEDISGYRLSGDIDFTFPSNTVMLGGTFLVVAKDPAALQSAYGISGVLGPYSNSLPAKGTLRLRSDINAILLEINYSDDNPWPVGADGTGHSLVLTRASYGQNDPKSWDASDRVGGSPGQHEPQRMRSGLRAVVINEILAHTDLPQLDYIELYNYSTQSVDISGCYLSDAASTNKFRIPSNTVLLPHGYISFTETNLGFALDHKGETIYFRSADASQMLDAVQYEAQENGVAFGRYPDGSPEFYRLTTLTPGTTNAQPRVDDVVINELMYGPISEESDDQYIELYNKGTNGVNIGGWRFTSGIDFKFPANTIIPADGYLVVAKNLANLRSHYTNLVSANSFGNYDGKLSRDGERVALAKPDIDIRTNIVVTTNGVTLTTNTTITTNTLYIVVEEVTYKTGGRWGKWANQGGSSLELIDPRANHRLAYNWGDSDETAKAPWTPFEHTGLLDSPSTGGSGTQGGTAIDRVEVIMLGEGECLLDDVEVRYPGMNNLLANPGFEGGLSGWIPQGNHISSTIENSGNNGARSLHVRTTGNGDTGANRVRGPLSAGLGQGQILTLKGYVRWLRGWPEITLRIKGGYLEAYGRMTVPLNLGTPGARNSRALTNNAPAIYGVAHAPVLPQTGDSVVVSAGIHDPDGLASVNLFYRVDSASPPGYSPVPMSDNGTGGDAVASDGVYSAMIPAQPAGTMISFYVEATDTRGAVSQFPANTLVPTPGDLQRRECLVRWGDPIPSSAFASYRLWFSRNNVNVYINRPALSNQEVDGTMVVNNNRAIYNMFSHYSNSPYHQGQNSSPETGSTHFDIHLPLDDKYLGTENFNKVHAPGNGGFDDTTLQRETTAYWFARKIGLPYLYRRHVAMYVNGNRKGGANAMMEDTQRPGGELVDEFFPDETEGRLYKLQPWFEFDDVTVTGGGGAAFDNKLWCTLSPCLSTNAHKITRYRQNYLTRSADKTANDYTNVIALINAANVSPTSPVYWRNFTGLVDVEEWAKIFAVEHAVGNWDSVGNRNAQNMYGWKPDHGKWKLMIWDYNIVLGSSAGPDTPSPTSAPNPAAAQSVGNLFQYQASQDGTAMGNLNTFPAFRRAWWRGYKQLVLGANAPMSQANVTQLVNAKYNAFRASGVNPLDPSSIINFVNTARNNIAAGIATNDITGFNVTTTSVTASSSNVVTITGAATFDVTDIELNGVSWPINWTTPTNWSISLPVTNGASISVVAYDGSRNVIGGTGSVSVSYSVGPPPDPRGSIVFNEIMYNPASAAPDAEYVELYNLHSSFTFNLSGWRLNGVDFTFPEGSFFPPRSFLVLAKDRVAFAVAYGASIPVLGEYGGKLQGNGETLTLIKPATATNEVDLIVDRVRYESTLPWSTNANGTGSALQLIDANQENARVGNWFSSYVPPVYAGGVVTPAHTNDGWRFVSATGNIGNGSGGGQFRLVTYIGAELGTALIDDIWVVDGTNAAMGTNYVRNGDFETPLIEDPPFTNSWMVGPNYVTNTVIVSDLTHSGSGALKFAPTIFGNSVTISATLTNNKVIYQALSPAPTPNSTVTLSFWFWATNSATNLTVKVLNSSAIKVDPTNINITVSPSNYVAPTLVSAATNSLSPGTANQLTTNFPAFPPLWINELQAENVSGIVDSYGEHDPWIEIYNTSANPVALDGLYLAPNYTNLTNWAFPPGSSIGPTQFLVVFCDGQPAQTSNTEYHTSFRLPPASGSIALSRLYTNAPQVLDYVNYTGLHSDRSYGSFPDGQPFDRLEFFYVTARGTNDGRSAPLVVYINEWMAANTNSVSDPADSDFDDWFELYNPGTNTVDLAGYFLTDSLRNNQGVVTNKFKYPITTNGPHTIAPHGFLLVWADNEIGQNTSGGVPRADMHVNFQLSKSGEALGLFAADGTQIDYVMFGAQADDVSQGRYPDGSANIYAMTNPTPRLPNFLAQGNNTPPVLDPIGNRAVFLGQTLAFTATAHDSDLPAQVLMFSLDAGAPGGAGIGANTGAFSWMPSALGSYPVTVRVTDNGIPPANAAETLTIDVLPPPSFANSVRNGTNLELTWGTRAGKKYAVDYKTDLSAASWTPLVTNLASGTTLSFTNATTSGQRFFRIRTVD